jgi:hypothetical protein
MARTGLAPAGDEFGVRWVAVRHAPDHIHLVATLARQDGIRPKVWDDFYRVRDACHAAVVPDHPTSLARAVRQADRVPDDLAGARRAVPLAGQHAVGVSGAGRARGLSAGSPGAAGVEVGDHRGLPAGRGEP